MTTRVLAVYDRSSHGDLAIEAAFQFARTHSGTELYFLAIPTKPDDMRQRETLHDDLLAFIRVGQHLDLPVDGAVIDMPDAERMATEIRQRKIDHLVIAEPAGEKNQHAFADLLDKAAKATGIATIVVHEENA